MPGRKTTVEKDKRHVSMSSSQLVFTSCYDYLGLLHGDDRSGQREETSAPRLYNPAGPFDRMALNSEVLASEGSPT